MKVLILMAKDGTIEVVTETPATVITVCDWAPGDRLYQLSSAHTVSAARVDEIIGNDTIGSSDDDRHEAIATRVISYMSGKPHLKPVT